MKIAMAIDTQTVASMKRTMPARMHLACSFGQDGQNISHGAPPSPQPWHPRSNLHARQLGDKIARCFGRYRFNFSIADERAVAISASAADSLSDSSASTLARRFRVFRGLSLASDTLLRSGAARVALLAIAFFEVVGGGVRGFRRCQIVGNLAVARVHCRLDLRQHAAR